MPASQGNVEKAISLLARDHLVAARLSRGIQQPRQRAERNRPARRSGRRFWQRLSLHPHFPQAWNNLGVILSDKKQTADAIAAYRHALALRPEFADAHYNLAISLHSIGETAGAIAHCRQAVTLRPHWPQACNNLGIWLAETAQFPEAVAAFDDALASRPDYAEAHNNRGQCPSADGAVERLRSAPIAAPSPCDPMMPRRTAISATP